LRHNPSFASISVGDFSSHQRRLSAEAGMLAGELFRLSGAPKGAGHERKHLNDAVIYLQARGIGASVVTGNIGDFDFLNQLAPGVPIILYRQA
jgi:hypothetical protein